MWKRESPTSLMPSPTLPRHLVARNTRGRTPRSFIQRPMISSVRPAVAVPPPSGYTSAVSKKSTPAANARSRIANDVGSSACTPKVMVPRHRVGTRMPVRPSGRRSIESLRLFRSYNPDMPVVPEWEEVERELLQDCRVFTVSRTTARSPHTGQPHPFYRIDSADWVNVVALTPDDELVMVRQYRHGECRVTLEIPGETPGQAAVRELLEETGYRARTVVRLGEVNPNPALFGNRTETWAALGAEKVAEIQNGHTEETVVELLPRAELHDALRGGRISSALVIAALYWFELWERENAR